MLLAISARVRNAYLSHSTIASTAALLHHQTVEATIGDKFHMLDRDKDGVVGAEELAFVIQHILSSHSTEEEALHIVQKLDADSDGQISVKELVSCCYTTSYINVHYACRSLC
jgi:Ca2+-binding EF-hand superfamily protein